MNRAVWGTLLDLRKVLESKICWQRMGKHWIHLSRRMAV